MTSQTDQGLAGMAEESDRFLWILTQESINHHDQAKKCQEAIQELMVERGQIELAYVQSLEKWAEAYTQAIRKEGSPYTFEIQEVLCLPALEAQAQADHHQMLHNDIVKPDGPCLKMTKLVQSIEQNVMVSNSNRVYQTAVSQYQSLVQRRQEMEAETRRRKQHYEYALGASRDIDEKLDGRRHRKTSRPMSGRKMEIMESRRYHLQKYSDVQLSQLKDQEAETDAFMRTQKQPLESIILDLNLFARQRLSDTLSVIRMFLGTLAKLEHKDRRQNKCVALSQCKRVLMEVSLPPLADDLIAGIKEKARQIIHAQIAHHFSLEELVARYKQETTIQTPSPILPGLDSSRSRSPEPLPDCSQNAENSVDNSAPETGGIPRPRIPTCGRSQIARVSHLLKVQSMQDDVTMNGSQPVNSDLPLKDACSASTMHAFYTSSSDSIVAKAGSAQPTACNSFGSRESVETLTLPPEEEKLSQEQIPFEVRNFCTEEEEEEAPEFIPRSGGRLAAFKKGFWKTFQREDSTGEGEVTFSEVIKIFPGEIIQDSLVKKVVVDDSGVSDSSMCSDEEEEEEDGGGDSINSEHSTHKIQVSRSSSSDDDGDTDDEDVTQMSNVRVRAMHSYRGRNQKELNLDQGQIIKQKMGSDEQGFSYGWTRPYKLGPKQYGRYPAAMVELFQGHRITQFETDSNPDTVTQKTLKTVTIFH